MIGNIVNLHHLDTQSKFLKDYDINPKQHGEGDNHNPLVENRDFFRIEHPIDLRPVCKLKVHYEKNRALDLLWRSKKV